ncbi:MAG: hypothetical protein K9N55_04910 [Phycisphaerae bacterium]|nr:hypothetical protein [Phycisphaerae bacterium]
MTQSVIITTAIRVLFLLPAASQAQTAYFADGYHGGIYGHYPMWQAKFMVDKLTEYPDWKINLEIEPETWDRVKAEDADNLTRLQAYYTQTGRFGRIEFVNPAYAQPYAYNISGESLIRHFTYGMAKTRVHFPDAAFLTYACEEPCFTSCLPQILTSLGFKYAVMRNPDTCWGGYTTAFGNDLVRWKASDGSSMLTVPRYACEGLVQGSTWQTESWNNSDAFIKACFDSGVHYPVGMCFQDAGWRGGPWLENAIRTFYRPTQYVTWTQYIDMIAPKVTSVDWDVTIEDIKPGLVWGAQVLQRLAQEIRVTENKVIMAEKMAAFDTVTHGTPYPEAPLDQAWRTLMLSQHHDCWIVPYNGRPGQTWADNVTRWTSQSNEIADRIIQEAFSHLCQDTEREPWTVTVFNTLGTSRSDLATVALPDGMDPETCQILDKDGQAVPSQITAKTEVVFLATVPSLGYTTFTLTEQTPPRRKMTSRTLDNGVIEISTPFYAASIDPAKGGTITSLVAKHMGHAQLTKPGQGLNTLRGFFYDKNTFISGSESRAKVSITDNGPLFIRLTIENELDGSPYIQTVTFYQATPRIDFDLTIDWQGQPGIGAYSQKAQYKKEDRKKAFYNDQYKLKIEFPIQGVGQTVYKNAPFDVCQSRLTDTLYDSWDTIKHNVILNWVDVQDKTGTQGVALFSDHTTSYINSPDMPLGLTVQYTGRGLWGRDYTLQGPTSMSYALLPHTGTWDTQGIHAKAAAWNEPFLTHASQHMPTQASHSLLHVDTRGIEVTSTMIENGTVLIRVFNAEAQTDQMTITWQKPPRSITSVALNGQDLETIPCHSIDEQHRSTVTIPRYGIRTLRCRF